MRILTFLFLLTSNAVPAQEFSLTLQALTNAKFSVIEPGLGHNETNLSFGQNNTYSLTYCISGGCSGEGGIFEINKNKLFLTLRACGGDGHDPKVIPCFSFGSATCEIERTPDSLYFNFALSCSSTRQSPDHVPGMKASKLILPFPHTAVRPGSKRMANGVPVISMGMTTGKTTDDVNIRKAPSITADSVSYLIPFLPPVSQPFVPKGTTLEVVARTEKKEKVKTWENYWYLVNLGLNREVWMFGEFLSIEN
ncbi:MAG: SH3 domain-containing protein [Spirochaetia bacterium]|nr:SH3 domain-containing protein [Spirochaetia bacterium]